MSIQTAGILVKQARREAFREAAEVVERLAKKIGREADREHKKMDNFDDSFSTEVYEDLESKATILFTVAGTIRRKAKRA